MIGESFAIIAVILVMAAMMAKSGRRIFAAFTLPLVAVPVFHLVAVMVRLHPWLFAIDIAGGVIGILICLLLSRAIRSKRGRFGYFFFCCFFHIALLIAYFVNLT